ncbi:hypothetical protein FH063_006670 [Azospirillum argentinense]|uniref:Uncharacterized protein n=1 Tax=Azospirillum argentinense TaxID=2970906 RepID=A0A5B0KU77_9PROT|nr:hypothetical protein FH063_006670 [Azospirillum argentinense]
MITSSDKNKSENFRRNTEVNLQPHPSIYPFISSKNPAGCQSVRK